MTEQHRFFLATLLSVGILFLFQVWFEPPPESLVPPTAGSESSSAATAPGQQSSAGAALSVQGTLTPWDRLTPHTTRALATEVLHVQLADQIPHLTGLTLPSYHETLPGQTDAIAVSLLQPSTDPMLNLRQAILMIYLDNELIDSFTFADASPSTSLTTTHASGVQLQVNVTPTPAAYGLQYTLLADNRSASAHQLSYSLLLALPEPPGETGWFSPPKDEVAAICMGQEGLQRYKQQQFGQQSHQFNQVRFAGLDRQYFLLAAIPQQATTSCSMQQSGESISLTLQSGAEQLGPGQQSSQGMILYAGPKKNEMLLAVDPVLTEAIDYNLWAIPLGFLARPMVAILNIFHQFSGNWGIAIILLTVLIKTILFPVTYQSAISMKKMQDLKPALDKLKQRFEKDPEKMQLEQMKLYKESGINPVAGCLPMLLQMPVWIALYRMLWSAVDLYEQPFLWIQDLTAKEPLPIMAIGVGLLTLLQQRLTPMAADNPQAKVMMYMMPVMLSVFMIALPSGLVLYILVNSVLTIVQQLIINRRTVAV